MTTTNTASTRPASVRIALEICDDLSALYQRNRADIAALCELGAAFDDAGHERAAEEVHEELWALRMLNQSIEKAFFAAAKLT